MWDPIGIGKRKAKEKKLGMLGVRSGEKAQNQTKGGMLHVNLRQRGGGKVTRGEESCGKGPRTHAPGKRASLWGVDFAKDTRTQTRPSPGG